MTTRIAILGGGTGGTIAANRLRHLFAPNEATVTVVDEDNVHLYQPGLLSVAFGLTDLGKISRRRSAQLRSEIAFIESGIESVDVEANVVHLDRGPDVPYDVLVIATGARLVPEETDGLVGASQSGKAFDFYTPSGALRLANALESFSRGQIVVNVVDMPIKCPVAPLEFCFLADWYFQLRRIRDRVDLTYVTPLDGAFTTRVASRQLGQMLEAKGIRLVTEFNTERIDTDSSSIASYDERRVHFDLAVVVPLHNGASYVGRSPGLGDALDFVPADPNTLQAICKSNVFVIGDAAEIPASKAGSVAHFEGEALAENVRRFLMNRPLARAFDGHANCFIECGFNRALLVDFNYATEPVRGHYPGIVGLPLLKPSRLNHFGKQSFQWLYWHGLLPGRDVPGITSSMPRRGKIFEEALR